MNELDDPIIAALHKHINEIAEMCNSHVKPWQPDSVWHAQNLFRELTEPYIDYMCKYLAMRPNSAFPVPWCNGLEDLVPVGEIDNYLD